jgi:hypothetical protein
MNKVTFIFLLMILFASCDKMDITTSQTDSFVKFYNTFPVFTGADVKEIPGKGYAVIGTVNTYTSGSQICLIRTDQYGNSLDSARYFGRALDDQAYCLQVLNDHGLAILGSSVDPATGKKQAYFIRTDSVGNTLWFKFMGANTVNTEGYHFEVTPDGSFIMTGSTESIKSEGLNKDIWLFGMDSEGNNLANWSAPRLIGGVKDDVGTYLQLLGNGNIVITGMTKSYPSDTSKTFYNHAFVIITNPIGGVNSFCWIASARDEEGTGIRILNDESFIVVGTSNYTDSGTGTDIMLKKVTITQLDQVINWEKTFGGIGNDFGNSLILRDNFLYMLVTNASAGTNSSIALLSTNLDGNNPVFSYIGEGTEMSGSSFSATSDNGFIIAGTNKHSDSNKSLALIKLKADGSL